MLDKPCWKPCLDKPTPGFCPQQDADIDYFLPSRVTIWRKLILKNIFSSDMYLSVSEISTEWLRVIAKLPDTRIKHIQRVNDRREIKIIMCNWRQTFRGKT